MKLSELDLALAKQYLRQDGDEDDRLIQAIIEASKSYICNYTGQSIDQLEEYEDITIAVLVLIAEFYDNRVMNLNNRLDLRVNSMLEGLLGRHSMNLL